MQAAPSSSLQNTVAQGTAETVYELLDLCNDGRRIVTALGKGGIAAVREFSLTPIKDMFILRRLNTNQFAAGMKGSVEPFEAFGEDTMLNVKKKNYTSRGPA